MTATTTSEVASPRRGLIVALQRSITRDEFFVGLYILGCTNGLLGRVLQSTSFSSWEGALAGIDINVIVLFAAFAGISTALTSDRDQLRGMDLAVGALFLSLVVLPIYPISWLAITGLCLYVIAFANGNADRRRGAIILLALSVPMLWSRLVFQFFANLVLDADAALVSSLLGTGRAGNMVGFADGSGYMVVLQRCSSLANMSLAFLCWISVTQWAKHRWSPADLLWSGLACAAVIAVNVTRISLMGINRSWYEALHNDWGDLVANTLMLALMVGFSVMGARRELFARP
jgi:exosortase/archaeosortase family protein